MKQSAGILLYRTQPLEFLLVHPGGPFWKNKDLGAWSIPKGEFADDELPFDAALREFNEETGHVLQPGPDYKTLNPIRLKSGKKVHAWALEKDIDAQHIKSNAFEVEWPPKSGRKIQVPEVDKAGWFTLEEGLLKINAAQQSFLVEVAASVNRAV